MVQSTTPLRAIHELLRLDPKTGALRRRRCHVQVLSGSQSGTAMELEETAVVGSGDQASLQFNDGTLSRLHFELTPRVEGVWVRDLGSTNGTYVGGIRIKEALVESEAVVLAGMTRLRIRVDEADVAKPSELHSLGEAKGNSPAMRQLFGMLAQVAETDSTVVLWGETGTGKEILARALHQASHRRAGPFVVVDCGALAPELLESELFGHVRGAFTGALTAREGAFGQADGGTVFLDAVGELPLELQPRLLRVLETGVIRRVGDDRSRHVDLRVVASSRADLEQEVAAGRFRQDLYFRLAVVPLKVPPLRERLDDVSMLAQHFVQVAGRTDFLLPPQLLFLLASYDWPGNVRQLRNAVERLLALGLSTAQLEQWTPADFARFLGVQPGAAASDPEKQRILSALDECGGNQTLAAKLLGMSRNTLASRLERYQVLRPRKKPRAPQAPR